MTDLLTRKEVAAMLRVSPSKLAHGWGPPPLPVYRRPVMYAARVVERWLREQEAMCYENAATSGGSGSSCVARPSKDPRVNEIERQQAKKRAASRLKKNRLRHLPELERG